MTTTQGAIRRLELLLARTPDMECADDLRFLLADYTLVIANYKTVCLNNEDLTQKLAEARRLLDDARAQKPLNESIRIVLREALMDGDRYTPQVLVNLDRALSKMRPLYAAPVPAQPAAAKGSTHCDECGCDWLDNGLNPVGCPYCKRNDDKFNPCLNSLVRQVALMMDDCEEHADGTITIDCDISQGFLRRIYDLLSALEDGGYDAIEPQPAAVPEAVAKDAAAILVQALEEIAWQRPLGVRPSKSGEAMERAAIIALHKYNALLSAADTEVKNG